MAGFNDLVRSRGSRQNGGSWDWATINAVWEKGAIIPGLNPAIFRSDPCGARMHRDKHGDTLSAYGWEIDHIFPVSAGGSDAVYNLQPLQWQNNRGKGATAGTWFCTVQN